jgi:hypothetical protein
MSLIAWSSTAGLLLQEGEQSVQAGEAGALTGVWAL